jgi:hypothetical protein
MPRLRTTSVRDDLFSCIPTQDPWHPSAIGVAYKSNEVFTEEHAWDLFFNMLEAGYVPFPLTSLPQLSSALKKK